MIECKVLLGSSGEAKLPGYFSEALDLGYTKNKGVYRLVVAASGEWEGLAIRCFWHVPGGKDPASSLVVDGYVNVPASVTAQPGNGCITFEGSDGSKTVTSADLRYRVAANSGTEDGDMPEPGTPAWEEFLRIAHDEFKGETGPQGEKGDTGAAGPQGEQGPVGPVKDVLLNGKSLLDGGDAKLNLTDFSAQCHFSIDGTLQVFSAVAQSGLMFINLQFITDKVITGDYGLVVGVISGVKAGIRTWCNYERNFFCEQLDNGTAIKLNGETLAPNNYIINTIFPYTEV